MIQNRPKEPSKEELDAIQRVLKAVRKLARCSPTGGTYYAVLEKVTKHGKIYEQLYKDRTKRQD